MFLMFFQYLSCTSLLEQKNRSYSFNIAPCTSYKVQTELSAISVAFVASSIVFNIIQQPRSVMYQQSLLTRATQSRNLIKSYYFYHFLYFYIAPQVTCVIFASKTLTELSYVLLVFLHPFTFNSNSFVLQRPPRNLSGCSEGGTNSNSNSLSFSFFLLFPCCHCSQQKQQLLLLNFFSSLF